MAVKSVSIRIEEEMLEISPDVNVKPARKN